MGFPEKPMFLYASIWDASSIGEATWTGPYIGCDAPYVCLYKDIWHQLANCDQMLGKWSFFMISWPFFFFFLCSL
ncbi:XYLOGLUCAN ENDOTRANSGLUCOSYLASE/HYDROLASE PROTEIN 8-RELATED [Salix viminalis]|uniref:XYLOGLUCAN ENDOTRANSGLUCOSYLASE/HYDROLASE PROTEIN 8-RELATED n=1 Tax=Salix viminalis TaxID=40686 RepID=A0A9Q0UH99_SALVM|nr:XYLOGLUCAN ENDOTRANSGLUCOSYLASE/HYDROLASE PROTEIN 8-RELATED [Salix viminalis]